MRLSIEDRFWSKVDRRTWDECWPWVGGLSQAGYGRFSVPNGRSRGRSVMASRFVYELVRGPIPIGLQLDHLCRNRSCVNPRHLEAVTSRENTLRGLGPTATNARKTHCVNGHEFTSNTTYMKGPWRQCRECNRIQQQRCRERKATA